MFLRDIHKHHPIEPTGHSIREASMMPGGRFFTTPGARHGDHAISPSSWFESHILPHRASEYFVHHC